MLPDVSFEVPATHPAFEGHFPGAPILPAVVLLDEIMSQLKRANLRDGSWRLASAKFLKPVLPEEALRFEWQVLATGDLRFNVRSGAVVVASGALTPAAPPSDRVDAAPTR